MKIWCLIFSLLVPAVLSGQPNLTPAQTEIMTLGVFHFAYPNLDAVKVQEEDQISVLDEPFQSEIKSIAQAVEEFDPTIIAVEWRPGRQSYIDSLYSQYREGSFTLGKNEVYQLGFRIGEKLDIERLYCVDDWGRHYENITEIFNDSIRLEKFEQFYTSQADSIFKMFDSPGKVTSIIDELIMLNCPERLRKRLAIYLLHPFKYEESPGDFTGVDFETGRWYNRNLRIFRNIQRIPQTSGDRVLLIVGAEHLNLLNLFFDASVEFKLVSPLPFLEKARVINSAHID